MQFFFFNLFKSLHILHLHISHNAPYLFPKSLYKHFFFNFSWDGCNNQEK